MKKTDETGTGSRAPTDVDRLVGENVRRLRLKRNGTLSGLSADLGISHQQLQKYETGSNRLSAGMISRLAEVFGVPITTLFQVTEDRARKTVSRSTQRIDALKEEGAWLLGRAESEETLQQMVNVLRVLAGKN
jgi:transcriptional regulator with XRE-family HTH domain